MKVETKFRAGKYMRPVQLVYDGGRIYFHFAYNKELINEIRNFEGRRYHGFDEENPRKIWSAPDTLRNRFQIQFLECKDLDSPKNPFYKYDQPLEPYETTRPLRNYQKDMAAHILTRKMCISAYEMGLGKTLAWIDATEKLGLQNHEIWYIGPRSGVIAVRKELFKWRANFRPHMMTYESLVKYMKDWVPGTPAPKMICFDESSRVKNPKSQRSEAALHLANSVRKEHGDNGYIVLMSGTPAPKDPTDWWHNCEVACPGFLKEPNKHVLKKRLCLVEERESVTGGKYPHIVTWYDDENKCVHCGQYKDHENHKFEKFDPVRMTNVPNEKYHVFEKSINEVEKLHKRMKGLVLIGFKKDLLDLPEKQYELIRVKPTPEILRSAKLIKSMSARAMTAINLLRELSDGFQYENQPDGYETCKVCQGKGEIKGFKVIGDPDDPTVRMQDQFEDAIVICDGCGGTGEKPVFSQGVKTINTPKDNVLKDLLDDHEDIGRFTVWGGFTATVDKVCNIAMKKGWYVLRVDGRGFCGFSPENNNVSSDILLSCMDGSDPNQKKLLQDYPRVCFIGNPKAGGMALTLTASPTALYYSNSFDGEARMQSEDRGHRLGMDDNKAYRIIDLIHLPTDELVLNNVREKKRLQNLTMGEVEAALNITEEKVDYYE